MDSNKSFWATLPGILTAIGGTIGATAALITALYTVGVIGSKTTTTPVPIPSPTQAQSQSQTQSQSPTPSQAATPVDNPTPSAPGNQTTRCTKPTTPVLLDPGDNTVMPNHHYGEGNPWKFHWLASACDGGAIQGYRILVTAAGATVPAIDHFVKETEYTGDLSGTISASNWTWKVRAVDDQNKLSDWSEERKFFVGPWK